MAIARQRPATANGIVFMLLEDEHGQAHLIVPPPVYGRYRAVSVVQTCSAVLMVGSILGCAVLQTASGYLALVAAQSAIIAIVAFCAHLWIKHEQADVTLGSGSAR